jgi:hypothetical protein
VNIKTHESKKLKMTRKTKNIRTIALTCSATALLSVSAVAQDSAYATSGDFARAPQPGEAAWQASVDSGYVDRTTIFPSCRLSACAS